MQIIRQPNDWTCLAACAAMITSTSIQDFIDYTGHDGSEYDETSPHPDKRKGYMMHEMASYLAHHKYHFGCHLTKEFEVDHAIYNNRNLAVLTVKSMTLPEPNTHLVVCTGNDILDPQKDEIQNVALYNVTEWWPIIQWRTG